MNLPSREKQLIIGALDSLGLALANENHNWSEGEKVIYEEAIKALGIKNEHNNPE